MADPKDGAKTFVTGVCALGILCVVAGTIPWQSNDTLQFFCYVALTAIASALKVVLPGLEGTVSVSFIFVLVGVCNMSLSETLALGLTAAVVQCYWRATRKLRFVQFLFNIAQIAIAITASHRLYNWLVAGWMHRRAPLALLIATLAYFVLNTMPVATVVALTEQRPVLKKWTESYAWTFPYYLVGAAIAGAVQVFNRIAGWEISVLLMPAIYAVYRSYRVYIGKLEFEKQHLEEMASVHMRTIETLALAIEAKDQTTHDHLQRVTVYAMELAKDLELSPDETEALRAAAVLHDIGKLAVPEHIISKPGRLTPEEFDKMKIHPIVGAEILEQVRFPYPVAPIVRSHHEKWDGSGYPDGLSGEAIPIGARILAAVDCLDALASDRQYRRALPLDDAMAEVEKEAGKSFDPAVVAVLKARYIELEQMAHEQRPEERPKLSTDVKVERGAAPAAGFAQSETVAPSSNGDGRKLSPGNRARKLAGIVTDLAAAHTLEETLALFSVRLRSVVAFDAIAFYALNDDVLTPQFMLGEQRRVLLSLRIPRGEGLSGWVAETHKCIMNGNPAVEPGFEHEPGKPPALRSALAVPLESENGLLGVITLYHAQPDGFNSDHLRIMQGLSVHLASTVEQWIRPQPGKEAAPAERNGKKPAKSLPRNSQANGAAAAAAVAKSRDAQRNGNGSRTSQPASHSNGSTPPRRSPQPGPNVLVFNPKLAK